MICGTPHEGVPIMVLMLDGSSEHVAHAIRKIGLFGEKFEFDDSVDLSNA